MHHDCRPSLAYRILPWLVNKQLLPFADGCFRPRLCENSGCTSREFATFRLSAFKSCRIERTTAKLTGFNSAILPRRSFHTASTRSRPTFGLRVDGGIPVTSLPAVASRSLPGRTSSPTARSASGWAAYVRRDAGTSTHPYRRATSRAPCCDGRRSRSPEPAMPCSRASNSRRPDLVVSLDYPVTGRCWLTQHVPPPEPRATEPMACLQRQRRNGPSGVR